MQGLAHLESLQAQVRPSVRGLRDYPSREETFVNFSELSSTYSIVCSLDSIRDCNALAYPLCGSSRAKASVIGCML
jgi:hypothetical protein